MDETPVLTSSLIVGAVGAGIAVAVAFGLSITEDQKNAILTAIPVFWLLIAALAALIKPKVTPNVQAAADRRAMWDIMQEKHVASGGHVRGATMPEEPTLAEIRQFQARKSNGGPEGPNYRNLAA